MQNESYPRIQGAATYITWWISSPKRCGWLPLLNYLVMEAFLERVLVIVLPSLILGLQKLGQRVNDDICAQPDSPCSKLIKRLMEIVKRVVLWVYLDRIPKVLFDVMQPAQLDHRATNADKARPSEMLEISKELGEGFTSEYKMKLFGSDRRQNLFFIAFRNIFHERLRYYHHRSMNRHRG